MDAATTMPGDWVQLLGHVDRDDAARRLPPGLGRGQRFARRGLGSHLDRGARPAARPAVATDIRGHRCSVVNGTTGVLAGPAELGDALASVLLDAERRARLGDAARAHAADADLGRLCARRAPGLLPRRPSTPPVALDPRANDRRAADLQRARERLPPAGGRPLDAPGGRHPRRRRPQPRRHGVVGRGGGGRARADQAATAAGQARVGERLPRGVRRRAGRGLRRHRLHGRRLLPRPGLAPGPAAPARRRSRRRHRLPVRARRGHGRLAAPPPPAVALGQPLHVAGPGPAGPGLHVGVPRLPGRRAPGHRPVQHQRRGLRLPDRARPAARAGRLPGDGVADRVPRPAVRRVEDVRPDHRRVDAPGHPLGPS